MQLSAPVGLLAMIVPLSHFESLGLVQRLALDVGVEANQGSRHQKLSSVRRHAADRRAGVSEQLPQAGEVRTQLGRSEWQRNVKRTTEY